MAERRRQIKVYAGETTDRKWREICARYSGNTAAFAVVVEWFYHQMEKTDMVIEYKGHKAEIRQTQLEDRFAVFVEGVKVGQFYYEDARDSNYSASRYAIEYVGEHCLFAVGALYASKERATKALIDRAVEDGIL